MTRAPGPTSPKAHRIADEVRRRILDREWRQGDRIPDEADLAVRFGAARATVNKALQMLAGEGLLDRRRRAGTRVAIDPARKAIFTIPIVREQVERAGMSYGYRVFAQRMGCCPPTSRSAAGSPRTRACCICGRCITATENRSSMTTAGSTAMRCPAWTGSTFAR